MIESVFHFFISNILALDQGWILLRYSFGDYFDDCNGYAVTEILFTCDHRDRAVSEVYCVCGLLSAD